MDLWDPKFKGKVALYSIGVLYSQEFLGVMTRVLGGNEKDIGPAIKKIKELRDTNGVVAFPTSPADMDNVMVQEQAWITTNASIRTLALKQRGSVLEYVSPKEGAALFMVSFNVVKGAPNPTGAQKFINHMLSTEMQTKAASGMGYAPVNKNATIPPEWENYMPTRQDHRFLHQARSHRDEQEPRRVDRDVESRDRGEAMRRAAAAAVRRRRPSAGSCRARTDRCIGGCPPDKRAVPYLLVLPAAMVFAVFFIAPLLTLTINSFYDYSRLTGIVHVFTLKNYQRIWLDSFYLEVVGRTLRLAGVTALVTMLVGYPVAIYLTLASARVRAVVIFLVLSPLLISVIVRTFGWVMIIGPNGLMQSVLQWLRVKACIFCTLKLRSSSVS